MWHNFRDERHEFPCELQQTCKRQLLTNQTRSVHSFTRQLQLDPYRDSPSYITILVQEIVVIDRSFVNIFRHRFYVLQFYFITFHDISAHSNGHGLSLELL